MDIIEQYQKELQKDTHVDELNVTQIAYMLPALKHKWVSRLINTKIKISKLEKLKKETKDTLVSKIKETSTQSYFAIDRTLSNNEEYKKSSSKIDEEIDNLKIIVLYLEKVENIFKTMTYDIKNIIDLNKLETT